MVFGRYSKCAFCLFTATIRIAFLVPETYALHGEQSLRFLVILSPSLYFRVLLAHFLEAIALEHLEPGRTHFHKFSVTLTRSNLGMFSHNLVDILC